MTSYERVNWENAPSKKTPLNANNLNKMDAGIKAINTDVTALETKAQKTQNMIAQPFNEYGVYSKDTLIVFNDRLYKAKHDVDYSESESVSEDPDITPTNFDPDDWDEVSVGSELTRLKGDLTEVEQELIIEEKTELIPNVPEAASAYANSGFGYRWFLSNRIIPAGTTIKTAKALPKNNYNYGAFLLIDSNNVVVYKTDVKTVIANQWNVFNINYKTQDDVRIAVNTAAAYTANDSLFDDSLFATDGLWESDASGVKVGDRLTFRHSQTRKFMLAVQWELESTIKVSDTVLSVKSKRPSSGYHNFFVNVNYGDFTDNADDSKTLYKDYGVIALPTNYSATGKPTKLIILCGGSGERINETTNPLEFNGWSYYLAKGYAVMDMNGVSTAWASFKGFPISDRHYCNKYLIESYQRGYEYVLNRYNIDKTKVFIAGISMGGGASALLVQSGIFPVAAHCCFCPALSVYKQDYLNPWGGTDQQKTIAGQNNFTDWNTTETFDQAYFLANIDKISGFDNLTIRTIGDIETANAHYGDTEEAAAYNGMKKIYPVPVKIWHCADDPTVLIRYSEFFVNMIKNAGGQAWLRKFETGAHVGGWTYGSANDSDVDGNAITTSIPFYESILFFERFG